MMGLQDGLIFGGCDTFKQLQLAIKCEGSIFDTFEAC